MTDIKRFEGDVSAWLNSDGYSDLVVRFAEGMSFNGITVRVRKKFDKPVVEVNWPAMGAVEPYTFERFMEQMNLAKEFADAAQALVDDHEADEGRHPFYVEASAEVLDDLIDC